MQCSQLERSWLFFSDCQHNFTQSWIKNAPNVYHCLMHFWKTVGSIQYMTEPLRLDMVIEKIWDGKKKCFWIHFQNFCLLSEKCCVPRETLHSHGNIFVFSWKSRNNNQIVFFILSVAQTFCNKKKKFPLPCYFDSCIVQPVHSRLVLLYKLKPYWAEELNM